MRKTTAEYKKSYQNVKGSNTIDRLANWTLKNDDKSFDSAKYKKNMNSFLSDIVESVNDLESKA
jgi:hypothetical protein